MSNLCGNCSWNGFRKGRSPDWPEGHEAPKQSVEDEDSRPTTGHGDPTVALHQLAPPPGWHHSHPDTGGRPVTDWFRTCLLSDCSWSLFTWWSERLQAAETWKNQIDLFWSIITTWQRHYLSDDYFCQFRAQTVTKIHSRILKRWKWNWNDKLIKSETRSPVSSEPVYLWVSCQHTWVRGQLLVSDDADSL